MLRSYRGIIAALVGLALFVALGTGAYFGALSAPHYGYQAAHPAHRDARDKQGNPSQIDRDRAGLPYFAERIASGPDSQSTQESDERDLAAQESMSVWAFWLLVVSAVGTLTTMIGTGFLLWQIILTRKAVQDTDNATKAMVRQNELTEAAQRPWIHITCKIEMVHCTDIAMKLIAKVTFKNIGKTMAVGVWPHVDVIVLGPGLFHKEEQRIFEDWRQPKGISKRVLMPGEEYDRSFYYGRKLRDLPWTGEGDAERFFMGIIAACHYHRDGAVSFDARHITERTFRIGTETDDPLTKGFIRRTVLDNPAPHTFVATQSRNGHTS